MRQLSEQTPVVLSVTNHDPSGASGIHADIESLSSIGCHCAPVISAITVQDTAHFKKLSPVPGQLIAEQARAILEDMPVIAIKIGMMASLEGIHAISQILCDYPNLPIVMDPNIQCLSRHYWQDDTLLEALKIMLLPLATVCHLTAQEVKLVAPLADTLDASAQEIMGYGVDYLLLTQGKMDKTHFFNNVYGNYRLLEQYQFPKLPHEYNGMHCTLSACITGFLAQGLDAFSAIHKAQEFTHSAMRHGFRVGMGKHLPNRLFWAKKNFRD